jgi:hypothetical protein
MPIKTPLQTPRFLSLHALAASRGDGLRPELVELFKRMAHGADSSLSETAPPQETSGLDHSSEAKEQETPHCASHETPLT